MTRSMIAAALFIMLAGCEETTKTKTDTTNMSEKFSAPSWIHNTNIYEVNLRQYTKEGTINAFVKEIPRLRSMGVEVLWFMPITPIAQKNKKGSLGSYYAAAEYTSVSPEFGTLDDFRKLVFTAHQQGMKVIIDWVANHTGWDHVWTKEHPEYYLKDSSTGDFLIASGMDDIIELDFSKPEVERAMIDAMKFWVNETGIDGFRCDLAFWVEIEFWKKARPELDSIKPLFWFGEFDELEKPEYGQVFDASYTWTWMHKTKEFYHQQLPVSSLDSVLKRYHELNNNCIRSWFTTNHDENSWNGTEYEKYGDMAVTLAVFSSTWKGIPLLYSGQELPNKKSLEFFEKDPIEWTGNNALHDFYKTLFSLRKNNPALSAVEGSTTERIPDYANPSLFAFVRKNGDRQVVVLLNLSNSEISGSLQNTAFSGDYRNIFSNEKKNISGSFVYNLPPWQYLVFEK